MTAAPDSPNRLYFGDNWDILRQYVDAESVDLICLDPPFNSNATYNVLFRERSGEESAAQITAFEDTWHWGWESETAKGDMERERAEIGVFITLQPPTEPMRQEALSAGICTPEHFPDQQHPRVQILTIDELLAGASVSYPRGGAPATFRQAPRRRRSQGRQSNLV